MRWPRLLHRPSIRSDGFPKLWLLLSTDRQKKDGEKGRKGRGRGSTKGRRGNKGREAGMVTRGEIMNHPEKRNQRNEKKKGGREEDVWRDVNDAFGL